jgi:endoglucanase
MPISSESRREHTQWLLDLTQIPTASGREGRVLAWIERWLAARPGLATRRDKHGNVEVRLAGVEDGRGDDEARPVYFTAHLDHPAFVVDRVLGPAVVELEFRGGVGDDYFKAARVVAFTAGDEPVRGVLSGVADGPQEPLKRFVCEFDDEHGADRLAVGDVVRWDLPRAEIAPVTAATGGGAGVGGESVECVHTDACDDLAAAAAALAAMDELLRMREGGEAIPDVRLLFTRAEEIGFIGAIGACKAGFMPPRSRIIALENSRSFADSPIGGGPVVRVGDRVSVFSPGLTGAVARRCEEIGGAQPLASQKLSAGPKWKWQRKLMAGGACEASVFCAFGYESTCVCLPLGNYHNMAELEAVQAERNTAPPRVGREFIGVSDYGGLVDLLVACGQRLPDDAGFIGRVERLWERHAGVLE